jgi:hypothetical protein
VIVAGIGCDSGGQDRMASRRRSEAEVRRAVEASPAPTGPAELLPDLGSLPAENLRIRVADEARELPFAGVPANVGVGPLIVRPDDRSGSRVGQQPASQLIAVDADGDDAYDETVSFCLRDGRRLRGARWVDVQRRYGRCESVDGVVCGAAADLG